MKSHRMLLANASHELRTPLSRIRLGIDLLAARSVLQARARSATSPSSTTIDEILLASRLGAHPQAAARRDRRSPGVAAEEGLATTIARSAAPPRWCAATGGCLSRMIRNLLDNARRHGAPPVRVSVRSEKDQAVGRGDGRRQGRAGGRAREGVHAVLSAGRRHRGCRRWGCALVQQIARLHGGTPWWRRKPTIRAAFQVVPAQPRLCSDRRLDPEGAVFDCEALIAHPESPTKPSTATPAARRHPDAAADAAQPRKPVRGRLADRRVGELPESISTRTLRQHHPMCSTSTARSRASGARRGARSTPSIPTG